MGSRNILSLGLGLLLVGAFISIRYFRTPENAILICMDTVRYDTFWLAENAARSDSFTPWAERAVRFTNTQSTSSWTLPAVASAISGLLPEQHGAGRFSTPIADLRQGMPSGMYGDTATLAQLLANRGYLTASFSAHPWTTMESTGLGRGYQNNVGAESDEDVFEGALEWLRSSRTSGKPFFLNLHLMETHSSHGQPGETIGRELQHSTQWDPIIRDTDLYRSIQNQGAMPLRYMLYARRVFSLRNRLSSFLTALEERDLVSETLILAYSDHGESFGERLGPDDRFEDFSFPSQALDLESLAAEGLAVKLPGHGQSLYQEVIRVPMLAWLPGETGRNCGLPASLVDIYSTLLSWLEIQDRQTASFSFDLLQFIDDADEQALSGRGRYSSGIAYGIPSQSVLLEEWKLIARASGEDYEMYNLDSDPGELHPLNTAHEQIGTVLRGLIQNIPTRHDMPPLPATITPEQLQRLRSLGYLAGSEK